MKKVDVGGWAGLRPGHAPRGHLRRRGGERGAQSGGGGRGVRCSRQSPAAPRIVPQRLGAPSATPCPGQPLLGLHVCAVSPALVSGRFPRGAGGGTAALPSRGAAGGRLRPSPFSRRRAREEARQRDGEGPREPFGASGRWRRVPGGRCEPGGSGTGEPLREGVRFTFWRWKCH